MSCKKNSLQSLRIKTCIFLTKYISSERASGLHIWWLFCDTSNMTEKGIKKSMEFVWHPVAVYGITS